MKEQKQSIIKLLKLEHGEHYSQQEQKNVWKIVLYDTFCKNVLSTIFKVGTLRELKISLHLSVNSKKQSIMGINAIYFLCPTQENYEQMTDDILNNLYNHVYIFFAYETNLQLLKKMADKLGSQNKALSIKQIVQHHFNFISLTHNLFTLNIENVFFKLNCNQIEEENRLLDFIAQSLLSVFKTCKRIPIIYYSKGLNEKVFSRLKTLISDFLNFLEQDHEDVYSEMTSSLNQPYLILCDRITQIGSTLMHPWHYASLIHDIIGIKNNKVTLKSKETENKSKQLSSNLSFLEKDYDLDIVNDKFWKKSMNTPFPCVGESLENEVKTWQSKYDQMSHKKMSNDVKEASTNLTEALDQIPELTDQKKRIDIHNNIATFILEEINRRKLDQFFEIEHQLLSGQQLTNEETDFIKSLNNFEGISEQRIEDIVRLIAIYYLSDIQNNILDQFAQNFSNFCSHKYKSSIKYIKELAILQKKQQQYLQSKQISPSPKKQSLAGMKAFNFVSGFAKSLQNRGKGMLKFVKKQFDDQENDWNWRYNL